MSAATTAVDDLIAAASDGVAFDGLRLAEADDGYRLETPNGERSGLDEADLRTALADIEEYVTNWRYWRETVGGEGTARRAFLRWCERAPLPDDAATLEASATPLAVPERYAALREGVDREWGELRVTSRFLDAESPDGERVYDVRHVDDRDADLADLEAFEEPRAAREIAKTDADGRYRPLKTAPSLVSGWAFAGLSGDELVQTVDFFYPATVANWHRERRDVLDVDHWRETAERQTGIYDLLDELPREAVDWMAEACCADSQCLRRREWEYEEGDELDADGGDGPFPCREPCSLVIAAARQWTILESETDRTYELELTAGELNQLSELIDAVADGRVDEVREADVNDGANRYRARYLRAKRFDEDGTLAASRSDEE